MIDSKAAATVEALTVAYRGVVALEDVSLRIKTGRRTAIVGPNGAGKSTLVKSLLGLLEPLAGRITLLGRSPKEGRREVAYVPQRESVDWDFPATALDVVTMGLYGELGFWGRLRPSHRQRALESLAKMGLAEVSGRQIRELSGGQQQRVFLARALVQGAELYLLDEPLAGVDAATERLVLELFSELSQAGKTVVAVHHDLSTVAETFDDVVLLDRRVVAAGPVSSTFSEESIRRAYGNPSVARRVAGELSWVS